MRISLGINLPAGANRVLHAANSIWAGAPLPASREQITAGKAYIMLLAGSALNATLSRQAKIGLEPSPKLLVVMWTAPENAVSQALQPGFNQLQIPSRPNETPPGAELGERNSL